MHSKTARRCTTLSLLGVLLGSSTGVYAAEVTPDQLEFRRQAVRRMIFDPSQDIPLSGLWPSKIVGLDTMHPPVGDLADKLHLSIEKGRLRMAAGDAAATSIRWVGGFNPFATYTVAVHRFNGSGEVGVLFRDTAAENRVLVTLMVENGAYQAIRATVVRDGQEVARQAYALPKDLAGKEPLRLKSYLN